jgi:hypothetical protein
LEKKKNDEKRANHTYDKKAMGDKQRSCEKSDILTQAKADSICQQRKLYHESNNDTILWQRKITMKATTIPVEQGYYKISAHSILQQRKDHKKVIPLPFSSRGRITMTAMLIPFTS